jgi:hypothetical protein
MSPVNRTVTELENYYSLFITGSPVYIFTKKLPQRAERPFVSGPETYDSYLALIRNNTKGLRQSFEEDALQILVELGVIDTKFRLTDLGIAVSDFSLSSSVPIGTTGTGAPTSAIGTGAALAGLFFYYWKIEEKDIRFVYPGLVVTAFLTILPIIEPDGDSITTLSDFLDFWLEMTDEFPDGGFRNIKRVVTWAEENYPRINGTDLEALLIWLTAEIDRNTVVIAGKFTKKGLLQKIKPLLGKVYYLFSCVRDDDQYYTTEGAFDAGIEVDMINYPRAKEHYQRIGVLRRGGAGPGASGPALVTIPLSIKTIVGPTVRESSIKLPPLPANIESLKLPAKIEPVVPIMIPFANLVGLIPLK